jgi:hypothetical protein
MVSDTQFLEGGGETCPRTLVTYAPGVGGRFNSLPVSGAVNNALPCFPQSTAIVAAGRGTMGAVKPDKLVRVADLRAELTLDLA